MLRGTLWRLRCVFALLLPAQAFGAQASTLNIVGTIDMGPTSANISCNIPSDSVCGTPATVNHGGFLAKASTGLLAASSNPMFGLITNLNATLEPVGVPISLPNFITFDLNAHNAITLTSPDQGSEAKSATCAGLTRCAPDVAGATSLSSNLDQTQTGTSLTIALEGVLQTSPGQLTGAVTAHFAGDTPAQALAAIEGAGSDRFQDTFSAQFVFAGVPAPATLVVAGLGLLGLGLFSRRRSTRR